MANKPIRTPSVEEGAINLLMNPILEIERRRLNRILIDLNQRNKLLQRTKSDGFLFAGRFEFPAEINGARPTLAQRPALHTDLWPEMEDLIKERDRTKNDLTYIRMILVRLIRDCKTPQEIRDALPDFLVPFFPPGKLLPRMQGELWTIRDDERAMNQYKQLEEKLALYAASRLIY